MLLRLDSFRTWDDVAPPATQHWLVQTPDSVPQTAGQGSRPAAYFGATDGSKLLRAPTNAGTAAAAFVGARFKFDNAGAWPSAGVILFRYLTNNGVEIGSLELAGSGTLRIVSNGTGTRTTLGTSSTVLTINTWHYVEFAAVMDPTAGYLKARVDGVTVLSFTGIDTEPPGGTPTFNVASIQMGGREGGGGSGQYMHAHDFYCCNSNLGPCNDFLGDVTIEALMPDADATHSAWTPSTAGSHFAMIDEKPEDADTTYLTATTTGQKDSWTFPDLPALARPELGIMTSPFTKSMVAGQNAPYLLYLKIGGDEINSGQLNGSPAGYSVGLQAWPFNPITNGLWTRDVVNALEVIVENNSNREHRITLMAIEYIAQRIAPSAGGNWATVVG